MTRFARAKGSKASNERVFEEATSWVEMKNQLLQKKKEIEDDEGRKEAEQKRNSNYQNFLKEKEEEEANQTAWADFPIADDNKRKKKSKVSELINSSKKNITKRLKNNGKLKEKVTLAIDNALDSGIETQLNSSEELNGSKKIQNKKSKKLVSATSETDKTNGNLESDEDLPVEVSSKMEVTEPKIKKVKKKMKKLKIVVEKEHNNDWQGIVAADTESSQDDKVEKKVKNTHNQIRKEIDFDSLSEAEKKKVTKKLERRKRQVEKKKLKKLQKRQELEEKKDGVDKKYSEEICDDASNLCDKTDSNKTIREFTKPSGTFEKPNAKFDKKKIQNKNRDNKQKPSKKEKDGDFKRRKDFQPNKMIINGREVEIEYFDGFPIKKEEALHLKKLKKEMISKGLPRSEINRTLKLERRKAEKALAREKKKVCFNCRKFGHNLSDCPDLANQDSKELIDSTGTGICFKCGSTEHTSFVCRVVQGQNFKFATCFICKEQGHISRQCPDNARGLYPKGGGCKVCGDVTHLKKDCPQFQIQQVKEEEKFQVETLGIGNPEDLDGENIKIGSVGVPSIKPNKIIKF